MQTTPMPGSAGVSQGHLVGATITLWRREMVRFFRQKNRVVSAMITPIMFWLMMGSGLNSTFIADKAGSGSEPGPGYLEYFFPGAVVMILLFTAIFSTITVIEERRDGFLQGVLVAPVSRLAIVMGKVLGGASIATIQGAVLLAFWPLIGSWGSGGAIILAVVVMFVLAVALTAMGLCIAWPMDSTAGFHAVMMVFLMPMWFLSGAVFPLATAPAWLGALMWVNPLTYGYTVFSATLLGPSAAQRQAPLFMSVVLLLVFTVGLLLLAARLVSRPRKDGT